MSQKFPKAAEIGATMCRSDIKSPISRQPHTAALFILADIESELSDLPVQP